MAETIYQQNIKDRFTYDMQVYAIALNRKQAVPNSIDGLKISARRVLNAMFFKGRLTHDKPYSKCAGVIGDTLKYYHPHGDSSVYGVLCQLATWWDSKIPLIDAHGNFGNQQGSEAAAYRYTECRLSEYTEECIIADLAVSKDIVDWVPNYNDTDFEPEYFPVRVPNLLINGTFGLGIGMRADIPTHNFNEVLEATINLIKDPNYKVVLVPDHCMPCDIIDTNWKVISNTGFGNYKIRARIEEETDKKGFPCLVIKGVPNSTTLFLAKGSSDTGIIANINEMIKKGQLPQILEILSDSKGKDLRYVIKLRKGSDVNYVKSYLYKHTNLEQTCRVNFETIEGIKPLRFSYKSYLEYFIEYQITLKIRSYAAKYQRDKTEWTKLQLYLKIMKSGKIEEFQKKINSQKDVTSEGLNKLTEWIIKTFKVTDIEAKYMLNIDLKKCAIGYLPIYERDSKQLEKNYNEYFIKMNDDNIIKQEILEDLEYFKRKYGPLHPRVCRVIKDTKDDIPSGTFQIVITENNFVKKIAENDPINTYRNDVPKFVLRVDNAENIIIFDKLGKAFKLPVHKVAMCDKNSQGFDLRLILKNCTSEIVGCIYEPFIKSLSKNLKKCFLVVLTRNNCIKKMDLDDFTTVTPSGLVYTKLSDGDFVQSIDIIDMDLDIIIYSDKKAISYNMSEVPHYKRNALGAAAMNSKEPIDGMSIIYPNATDCIVITEQGKANKFNLAGLKRSSRNRAGNSVIKLGKTDNIVSIYGTNDNNILSIITKAGVVEVPVRDIPASSSAGAGVKLPIKAQVIKVQIR